MQLKRHQKFWKDVEEEWSKKFITFIKENPDKPWVWDWISGNPNITMENDKRKSFTTMELVLDFS